jgi:hypothetical protein
MAAYEASLGPDSTLVLSPDSDFFKYFRSGPGGGKITRLGQANSSAR